MFAHTTDGIAGEILATIASEAFIDLDAPIERVTKPDCPIPYNIGLMEAVLRSVAQTGAKIQELLDFLATQCPAAEASSNLQPQATSNQGA